MLGWHKRSQIEEVGANKSSPINCSNSMVACLFEAVVTMEYMVYYNFFACVLLPLLLMFGIYLKIFMAARRQLKQMENKMVHGERSRSTLQKEVHAAKSLAIIVGLFAVCWLPLHIINCFTLFCPNCAHAPLWLMYLAIILSHANSVVNPLIYAYRIREFRYTFRKIISQHILGRKEQFKAGTASIRTSTHGGDEENASIRISEYALEVYTNGEIHRDPEKQDLNKCKAVLEWHQNGNALDMETNGHLPRSCKNGILSDACVNRELHHEELIDAQVSFSDLETTALATADVSWWIVHSLPGIIILFSMGGLCHGRRWGWGAGGEMCIQVTVEKGSLPRTVVAILNTRLEKSQETLETDWERRDTLSIDDLSVTKSSGRVKDGIPNWALGDCWCRAYHDIMLYCVSVVVRQFCCLYQQK